VRRADLAWVIGRTCVDPVLRGAVLFDDRTEPEEAEKVAGDAGAVEAGDRVTDEWRDPRHGALCKRRCCRAARAAGWCELEFVKNAIATVTTDEAA